MQANEETPRRGNILGSIARDIIKAKYPDLYAPRWRYLSPPSNPAVLDEVAPLTKETFEKAKERLSGKAS